MKNLNLEKNKTFAVQCFFLFFSKATWTLECMERLPACFQLQTGNNQELGNCKYNTSVLTVSLGTGVSGVPCQDP